MPDAPTTLPPGLANVPGMLEPTYIFGQYQNPTTGDLTFKLESEDPAITQEELNEAVAGAWKDGACGVVTVPASATTFISPPTAKS